MAGFRLCTGSSGRSGSLLLLGQAVGREESGLYALRALPLPLSKRRCRVQPSQPLPCLCSRPTTPSYTLPPNLAPMRPSNRVHVCHGQHAGVWALAVSGRRDGLCWMRSTPGVTGKEAGFVRERSIHGPSARCSQGLHTGRSLHVALPRPWGWAAEHAIG